MFRTNNIVHSAVKNGVYKLLKEDKRILAGSGMTLVLGRDEAT